MCSRVRYAGRLLRLRPRALVALLHVREKECRLPWVTLLLRDLEVVRAKSDIEEVRSLPPADVSPCVWTPWLTCESSCARMVNSVFFVASVCDRASSSAVPVLAADLGAHSCAACDMQFASGRALESHRRAKHGDRLGIRRHVAGAVCPHCLTDFRQRLRCLAHLSDRRRPLCREWVVNNVASLPDAEVKRLDEIDRTLRRVAQREGRSHHVASLPATSQGGNIAGRVQRCAPYVLHRGQMDEPSGALPEQFQ